jgi:hypothetical protein
MRSPTASDSPNSGDPPKVAKPRRAGRILLVSSGVALVVVVVLAGGVFLNRRAAAQSILTGWLEQQGVHARVEVQRIELDGFTGRIEIGDPAHPDFVVERAEVDYAIGAPWSRAGFGVTPGRIRLVRPVLAARWHDGKLSLGSLDPLIEKFTGQPPKPDSHAPLILVEGGRLRLQSDYGAVDVLADATVNDGKLLRLVARMPAASLRSGETTVTGLQADVDLTTTGDRIAVTAHSAATALSGPGGAGRDLRLTLIGALPYPDLKSRRGDGRARIEAALAAGSAKTGDNALTDAALKLTFDGQTQGWIEAFRITGATDLNLTAREAGTATLKADGVAASATGTRTEISRSAAGLATTITGPLAANADRLRFDELDLRTVRSTSNLRIASDTALRITADAAVTAAHGAWPLFGPVASDDIPELAGMKRALGDFALNAPAVRLTVGPGGTEARLSRPVRLTPANGGVLTLTGVQSPVFAAAPGRLGGGALSVTATRGQGLPEAGFAIPAWSLTSAGFTADLNGQAALDFGLARTLTVATRGRLTSATGRLTYAPSGCSAFTAGLLELGENDVSDVAGQLCPGATPLVAVADDGWHVRGRFAGVSAAAPFLEARVVDAAGDLTVDGSKSGDLTLSARVEQADVRDAAAQRRFNPLRLSGTAGLAKEQWTGTFDLASGDHPLGQIALHNNGVTESGGLTIDTGMLTFAQGGLQPLDLSPLVAGFISPPVTGQAQFVGRFDWTPDTQTSSGVITIPGLDFVSPVGDAKGLKGTVVFTSLVPPTTAPNQMVTLDSLASVTPLTDLKLDFGLDASAVTIGGADLKIGGGIVRIEPLAIPFDRSRTVTGALVLENVQIGNIFSGAGLDDKVKLDAVVSGRVPFTSGPEGVRVIGGVLNAVQPGRLSLQREALSGLEASNVDDSIPPNAMTDLAYQALENLAFDDMTVIVNSLDAGRLNLRFAIHGRHDPPNKQEIRLTWLEVLQRRFFDKPLPLPSGTGVNLNLDTTLNANQLIGDLLELNRVRQGKDLAESPPTP